MDTIIIERLERLAKSRGVFISLFSEIYELLNSFICFQSDDEPIVLTNWVVSTWAYECFMHTPYIHIYSPDKRCGKSLLLDILSELCKKSLKTSQPSSAIYRWIQENKGTLFIDEIDTLNREDRSEFYGILNQGFSSRSGGVLKMVGNNHTPTTFDVYCPKLFSGIGADNLTDTLRDRSIPIELQRKTEEVKTRRLIGTQPFYELEMVAIGLEQLDFDVEDNPYWSEDDMLEVLDILSQTNKDDRAVDICIPIVTIASMGSPEWLEQTINACNNLTQRDTEEQSWEIELLGLCKKIMFLQTGKTNIQSRELAIAINDFDESRFVNWNNGNGINPSNVARALRSYGIKSKSIRQGTDVSKGYEWNDFLDAFDRYLPKDEVQEEDIREEQVEIF